MHQLRQNLLAHYVDQMDIATIVQRHPDPILVISEQNEILYTNTAGARLLCRLPVNNGFIHDALVAGGKCDFVADVKDLADQIITLAVSRLAIRWQGNPACLLCLHDISGHIEYSNELEQLLLSDHLTGLYNRRGLEVLADQARNIAIRHKQAISVFYIDINDLKYINDTYGHNRGDAAIVETAKIIKRSFRNTDVSARIGGDEFVVLVLEDAETSAGTLLNRLRNEIDKCNTVPDRCYTLSISVGVGHYEANREFNIYQLIREADRRLYLAKKQLTDGNLRQCNYHRPLADERQDDVLPAEVQLAKCPADMSMNHS